MFSLDILLNVISNNLSSQKTIKLSKIYVISTDIEKSELPGKKQNENNISYCLRMINNGLLSFYNNYKLDYCDVYIPEITKKIVIENKGSLKKLNDETYIYHSQHDMYFLIWCNNFGFGWNNIDITQTEIGECMWDIENQITY